MKNLPDIFLRSFAFYFMLFTLPKVIEFFFFPTYIHDRIWPPIHHGLLYGLIFGSILGVVSVLIQSAYVNKAAKKNNVDYGDIDYGIHQTMELEIGQSSFYVCERLKNNLLSKNWKIAYQDEAQGVLQFKVEHTSQFHNDVVTIQLQPSGMQHTIVKVDSRMDFWLKIIDYGSNFRNVQQVRQALSY